jgi:hypothetical protein
VNGPRTWITVLAGTSFLTGLAAGLLFSAVQAEEPGSQGEFAGYQDRLVEQFELSAERSDLLGVVLANYEQDLVRVQDHQNARSMKTMEPELRDLGKRYWGVIRESVIPLNSRGEFDRFAEQNLVVLTMNQEG